MIRFSYATMRNGKCASEFHWGQRAGHVGRGFSRNLWEEWGSSKVFKFPAVLSLRVIILLLSSSDLVAVSKKKQTKPAVLELPDA